MVSDNTRFDCIVVGGGPAGSTAADDLARAGHRIMLLDRQGRIKPCGGAIPPRAIADFDIPDHLICAKVRSARMISPSNKRVDMPIENGFVGMVNRETFDEYLRDRAEAHGVTRERGEFVGIERDHEGMPIVMWRDKLGQVNRTATRMVIGADGANSKVAKIGLPKVKPAPFVFAYHEIIKAPKKCDADYDPLRCDVYYQGKLSPDFYAWVFPHGDTASVGVGSAKKGFSLRAAVGTLLGDAGLSSADKVRHEGAPIPMKPIKRWDNGKDIIVTGDAAGCVAPASGEGIYYAMACARMVASCVQEALVSGDARALASARKLFLKEHGKVFFILGLLQYFWYGGERRREQFVKICKDEDVQRLTWESYMHKRLVKREPMAHLKVFVKDVGHLLGIARV